MEERRCVSWASAKDRANKTPNGEPPSHPTHPHRVLCFYLFLVIPYS